MLKEKLSKYLLSSCNKTLKSKIENFLFKNEDLEFSKSELIKVKFYNQALFSELDIFNKNKTLKKNEDSLIIQKLLTLGYNLCPDKLISELAPLPYNYKFTIYKALRVSDQFIIADLEYNFKKIFDYNTASNLVKEVIKKFPHISDIYLHTAVEKRIKDIMAMMLEVKYQIEGESVIPEIENFILNSLCEVYSSKRIKNILKYDFKAENLAQSLKDSEATKKDDNELIYFLKDIYEDLDTNSANRDIIFGIFEILTFPDTLNDKEILDESEYCRIIIDSNLPFIYKLVYLYKGSEDYDITSYLKNFILNNHSECIVILERMSEQNIELGAFILGVLLQNKSLTSENKELYIKKYIVQLDLLFNSSIDRNIALELINTLGYMFTYCNIENYIVKLFDIYIKQKFDTHEFINLISHYERLIEDKENRNIWEFLANKSILDKKFLIIGTIEYVNISSEKEFTKFLKNHEEIFYDLLSRKVFDEYHMKEVLDLSYNSEIEFDVTKILSYLNTSDDLLLQDIFEILKKKENECKAELEKLLSKGRNKKLQFNVEKLKNFWKINVQKEFETVTQLEEYIFTIFDNYKKYVPYPKLEAYSQVKDNLSKNFLDEKVVKLYVALYSNSDFSDKIKLGEIIKKFVNLSDLNRCLNTLFDTWIKDNTPLHFVYIPRLYLETTDYFGIDKVLNLFSNLISKAKFPLIKKLSSILSYTQLPKFYSEIKYIKAGIGYNHLSDIFDFESFENKFDLFFEPNFDFSMGFDSNGIKTLDYGNRKIKLSLNKDFEISIYNQNDKEVKTLPKYSAKFQDNEDKVNFYQKDFKKFKNKKIYLLEKLNQYMFYQMIGNRAWTEKEWQDEINSSYFTKVIIENILWKLTSNEESFLCKYIDNKFIDIQNNIEIKNFDTIKIYYSGEVEKEINSQIETLTKNNFTPFLKQQFSIIKKEPINFNDYFRKNLPFNYIEFINLFYGKFFNDSYIYNDSLVFIDKINKLIFEIELKFLNPNLTITDIKLEKLYEENISFDKINPRFLNFTYFILDFILTGKF